ncbi:MAG TPA: cytochrome c oxidase subunit II [Gemmatimonadetes bacterium]|jgi:cytochrome c553|nr:cytochrome c oxidase subunit II [Gemmatimonadota bacterium]HAY76968.1 cytochrome c oxidase subunit II [Gemmatimonadota bacterium]
MMVRLPIFGKALLPLLLMGAVACDATPPPVGMERGAELFETCAPCHGDAGVGKVDIAAPAIAGLPQWYVEDQLRGFQKEYRGDHADDLPGLRMRPMAVSLNREGDVESVAQYVASLEPVYPQSTLHGDAGAGAGSYVVCVACHGEDGLGNKDLHAPPIVQLDDWYLLTQLRNFKSGARGARTDDIWGQTMRVNSLALTDEGMQDVIAYVQTLR